MHAKVEHAPPNSLDWAESGFTITVMPDGLTPDGILLVGEGERNIVGTIHVIQRTRHCGDVTMSRGGELDIGKSKRGTATRVSVGRDGVFARTAQKVECDDGHIQEGAGKRLVRVALELELEGLEDAQTDGPDAGGGWVFVSEELVEALEAR